MKKTNRNSVSHNNISKNKPSSSKHTSHNSTSSYEEKIKSSRTAPDWDRFFSS